MPTFIGKPVTVAEDKQLQVGDILRDFNLTATDLSQKTLSEFDGKKKVISILPSIDTGICSTQTRTFNMESENRTWSFREVFLCQIIVRT